MPIRRLVLLCCGFIALQARAQPVPTDSAGPAKPPAGTRLFAIPADAVDTVVELDPVTGAEKARWVVPLPPGREIPPSPRVAYDGVNLFYLTGNGANRLARLDSLTGRVRGPTVLPFPAESLDAVAAEAGRVFVHEPATSALRMFTLEGVAPAVTATIPLPADGGLPAVTDLAATISDNSREPVLYATFAGDDRILEIQRLGPRAVHRFFASPVATPTAIAAVEKHIYLAGAAEPGIVVADADGNVHGRIATRYSVVSLAAAVQARVRLHIVAEAEPAVRLPRDGSPGALGYSVWAEIIHATPAVLGLGAFALNVQAGDASARTALPSAGTQFSEEVASEPWGLLRDPGRNDDDPHGPVMEPELGDLDGDGDRDAFDLIDFEACFSGFEPSLPGLCGAADLDGSGFVDPVDFALFQRVYTGSAGSGGGTLRGVGASQFVFADPRLPEPNTPRTIVRLGVAVSERAALFSGVLAVFDEGVVPLRVRDGRAAVLVEFSRSRQSWTVQELPVDIGRGVVVTSGSPLGAEDFNDPPRFGDRWTVSGDGQAEVVDDPDRSTNFFLRLTAPPGGSVSAERDFDAASRVVALRFRYHFLSSRGEALIFLNGVNVARLHAPASGRPGAADSLARTPGVDDPGPETVPVDPNRLRFGVFSRNVALAERGVDARGGLRFRIVFRSAQNATRADEGLAAAEAGDGIEIDDVSAAEPEDCAFIPPGDFDGDAVTTIDDFGPLDAFYGRRIESNAEGGASCTGLCCLDQLTGDGYIDSGDYAALDAALSFSFAAVAAGTAGSNNQGSPPLGPAFAVGDLVVLAKDELRIDGFHELEPTGQCVRTVSGAAARAYTRLRFSPSRQLYVVNHVGTLERYTNVDGLLIRDTIDLDGEFVSPTGDLVTLPAPRDVAFDKSGHVYICPVAVHESTLVPRSGVGRFRIDESATPARLELRSVYTDPARLTHPREVAVDGNGNVYATNGESDEHGDWIVVFDRGGGEPVATLNLQSLDSELGIDAVVFAPMGLQRSTVHEAVYVASALDNTVYRFALDVSDGVRFVRDPPPVGVSVPQLDYITDLAEDPRTGRVWISGFRRVDSTLEAAWAEWSGEASDAPVPLIVETNGCATATRPLGLAMTPGPYAGDFDDDGDVDLGDLLFLHGCFTGTANPHGNGCAVADFDGDGDVDLPDVVTFQSLFTGSM